MPMLRRRWMESAAGRGHCRTHTAVHGAVERVFHELQEFQRGSAFSAQGDLTSDQRMIDQSVSVGEPGAGVVGMNLNSNCSWSD